MAKKSTTQTSLTNQKYAIYLIIALLVVICGAVIFLANSVQNADRAYTTSSQAAGIRPPRVLPTRSPVRGQEGKKCTVAGISRSCSMIQNSINYTNVAYDGKSTCGSDFYKATVNCCNAQGEFKQMSVSAGELTGGTCATKEDLTKALMKKCGYSFGSNGQCY